jgi:hypothetical protein
VGAAVADRVNVTKPIETRALPAIVAELLTKRDRPAGEAL